MTTSSLPLYDLGPTQDNITFPFPNKTMKASSFLLLCVGFPSTESFVVPVGTKTSIRSSKLNAKNEFEYLLNENGSVDRAAAHSRRFVIPGSRKQVKMTSSVAAPTEATTEESAFQTDDELELGQAGEELSQGGNPYEQQLAMRDAKLQKRIDADNKNAFVEWIDTADFGEIVTTLFLPGIVSLGIINWGIRKSRSKLSEAAEESLTSFANEMIYHDGNFDEMELCKKAWSGKLSWLGPKKSKMMIDAYLEDYARRKPISPQAIRFVTHDIVNRCFDFFNSYFFFVLPSFLSSVSYVLSLFKMSEEKAADTFVTLCYNGGSERLSSANKLLFIGTQLFKTPEASGKLKQIKDMIKGTYRVESGGDAMVDASQ